MKGPFLLSFIQYILYMQKTCHERLDSRLDSLPAGKVSLSKVCTVGVWVETSARAPHDRGNYSSQAFLALHVCFDSELVKQKRGGFRYITITVTAIWGEDVISSTLTA